MNAYFEFNEWSSPLLPGFLQGVVFASILTLRGMREERISDYFAALLLLFGSFYVGQWMFGFAGWYDSHDWRTTLMFYVEWRNFFAFGPLIWLYFRSLTNTDFRWQNSYWWHFLPMGIVWLEPLGIFLYDWIYWKLILGRPLEYFHGTRGPASEWGNSGGLGNWYYSLYTLFSCLHLVYYLVKTILEYRHYRNYLSREFSNTEQLTLRSLRYTLYFMLVGVLLTFTLEVGNQLFSTNYVDSWDSFFVMSLFNFFVAVQFLVINPTLTRALRFEPDKEKSLVREPAAPARAQKDPELGPWAEKLEQRLALEEDYLNPDLKLGDLAEALGTNTSVLSRVINNHYGKNFNDLINGLRCTAFQRKIEAGAHLRHTLLSIAMDCGFNSKSTFNRAFRKHTGYNPREAVKRIAEPDEGADAGAK